MLNTQTMIVARNSVCARPVDCRIPVLSAVKDCISPIGASSWSTGAAANQRGPKATWTNSLETTIIPSIAGTTTRATMRSAPSQGADLAAIPHTREGRKEHLGDRGRDPPQRRESDRPGQRIGAEWCRAEKPAHEQAVHVLHPPGQ
jgi:hypothetical protein